VVQRRKPWNGNSPSSEAEARRILLDVTRDCIERFGLSKVGLSDVASAAGVTRQTVYRYFADAEDLFNSAAVLASGGFLERMRTRVLQRQEGLAERMVETLVLAIDGIPKDPHLSTLAQSGDFLAVSSALKLAFVQEEMLALSDGSIRLDARTRDELAEILLRLLNSFLADPGPERNQDELRAFLFRWLVPLIEEKLRASMPEALSKSTE
jgi:AcrR family transcriptional regulator